MAFREVRPPPRAAAAPPEPDGIAKTFQRFAGFVSYLGEVVAGPDLSPAQGAEIEKKFAEFQQDTIAILGPLYRPPSQELPKAPTPGRPKPPPRSGAFRSEASPQTQDSDWAQPCEMCCFTKKRCEPSEIAV
jgi:hypothetical protein